MIPDINNTFRDINFFLNIQTWIAKRSEFDMFCIFSYFNIINIKFTHMIEEPNALNDVAKFHRLFNMPIETIPIIPSESRCELRVSLIAEELEELKDAIEERNIVEIADALADLQYVLSGAILEFGLADQFKSIFDEVQRSNMSKACLTIEEAKATQDFYLKHKNTTSTIEEKEGEFLVFRVGDRKVLKSINYSPANIQKHLF